MIVSFSNLIEGSSYCVEENYSTEPSNPTSTTSSPTTRPKSATTSPGTTTSSSASGPSPTQSGLTRDCQRFYFVESGDSCVGIVNKHGTFTLSQFYAWNPAVGTSCQGLQAGVYVCIGVQGTPTTRPTSTTTRSQSATTTPNGPQPQQPNIRKDCQRFHKVVSGDTCEVIVNRYRTFDTKQFISWNPDVGSACTSLFLDFYVCIGVLGTPTSASSSSRTTATGIVTPSPIQSGTISTCNRFVKSGSSGASCQKFSGGNRISLAQLYAWNRVLGVRGENCGSFSNSMNYCVSVSRPLPPPNNGPVQSGVPDTCWRYGDALPGGTCAKFADRFGISLSQLYAWNPVLGNNGQNCQTSFWSGYWYCVQVAG